MTEYKNYLNNLKKEFTSYLKQNNIKNVVLGLSGGIDSAVCLAILKKCLKPQNIFVYFIDIKSTKTDKKDALDLSKFLDINLKFIDLSKEFKILSKKFSENGKANLKARLRMAYLYDRSLEHNAIVIGTSNYNELYLGYHTKHGDSACDFNLLSNFIKKDIYNLALLFKLPQNIISKKPSAGLFDNQTDEEDLQMLYSEMDDFFNFKNKNCILSERMSNMHIKNYHKITYNYIHKPFKKYKGKLWK